MAVAIRLRRMGRKKKPFYRMVVAHKANPQRGKFVDDLGYYDPMKEPAEVETRYIEEIPRIEISPEKRPSTDRRR